MSKIGEAPCKNCNYYCRELPLTGQWEPDGDGGRHWEIEPGQFCPDCSEPLNWLHQPPSEDLVMETRPEYVGDETGIENVYHYLEIPR